MSIALVRIIAAEIPEHRDHLLVAFCAALVVALGAGIAVALLPPPPDDVRWLERARRVRAAAVVEAERRRALPAIDVDAPPMTPLASHAGRAQPSTASLRAWFEERVRPALASCNRRGTAMHGAITVAFDEVGVVERALVTGGDATFTRCAQTRLARLAHVDAFELTFTWRYALEP